MRTCSLAAPVWLLLQPVYAVCPGPTSSFYSPLIYRATGAEGTEVTAIDVIPISMSNMSCTLHAHI